MGFATVKSDPWKKGARKRRRRFQLWPEEFWRKISDYWRGKRDKGDNRSWIEMIGDMNEELYGKR